jgi:undecaprenyl-diphosphatase
MPYILLALGIFAFIFSILILKIPRLNFFDWTIIAWFSQHRSPVLTQMCTLLSHLGGMPFVLILSSLWCIVLTWYKKYTNLVFICVVILGGILLIWCLKFIVARPRPPVVLQMVETYGSSFPSAHSFYAAMLASLAILTSQRTRQYRIILLLGIIWLLLMGVSRMYLGAHFPSDVLAGWSTSFIWVSLLYLLAFKYRNLQMKKIF